MDDMIWPSCEVSGSYSRLFLGVFFVPSFAAFLFSFRRPAPVGFYARLSSGADRVRV